jgi:hypothetical protein
MQRFASLTSQDCDLGLSVLWQCSRRAGESALNKSLFLESLGMADDDRFARSPVPRRRPSLVERDELAERVNMTGSIWNCEAAPQN